MASCLACNIKLEPGATHCHICGNHVQTEEVVLLGTIEDKMTADLAREVLASHGFGGTVISRAGFFGEAGLPLQPFFKSGATLYEVIVAVDTAEEAADLLDMTVGDGWKRSEE